MPTGKDKIMSRIYNYFVVHANLSGVMLVLLPIAIVCSIAVLFNLYSFDRNILHSAENIFIAERTWLFLLLIILIFYGVSSVRNVFKSMERKKLEDLLQSAWRTGKVVHNGKTYIVEEFSELENSNRSRKRRCLIVRSENGDSMIYRLPVEKASEYKVDI
jgi:hypothetical protein